jgi:hypothetical protein
MKMIEIEFEDRADFYWVDNGALKQITCDATYVGLGQEQHSR